MEQIFPSQGPVSRRHVIGAGVAGVTLVALPTSVHAASGGGGFDSESGTYSAGSTATIRLRFDTLYKLLGNRGVLLEFHRSSYVPAGTEMSVTVDWGDGNAPQTYTSSTSAASFTATKTFATDGLYTVSITNATPGIGFGSGSPTSSMAAGMNMLTEVVEWANLGSLRGAFFGASNLTSVPAALPSGVNDLAGCFSGCTVFNSPAVSTWETGAITSMELMFNQAHAFNQNIGSWNLLACTNTSGMLQGTRAFNNAGSASIGTWNTANVTNMSNMFYDARQFQQPIGTWNTANVTNMSNMFYDAPFNQDIGSWNTANVTDMSYMFAAATSFNQNIGSWDLSACTNASSMFLMAWSFNNGGSSSIGNWNTANVANMSGMFQDATVFNQNIGSWNTGNVTDMSAMFESAKAFNQNIGSWNTGKVTTMSRMFFNQTLPKLAFDQNISGWTAGWTSPPRTAPTSTNFVSTNASYYQSTWLKAERPFTSPSFN